MVFDQVNACEILLALSCSFFDSDSVNVVRVSRTSLQLPPSTSCPEQYFFGLSYVRLGLEVNHYLAFNRSFPSLCDVHRHLL